MRLTVIALAILAFAAAAPAQRSAAPGQEKSPVIDGLTIGAIPKQELPVGSCAVFLWTQTQTQSRALIAMMTATPATIRFAPGGAVTDLVRVSQEGAGDFGFAATSQYLGGDLRVRVDIDIVKRGDLTDGAVVPQGTIRIDREGQDSVIVPVGGLIGCG